MASLTNHLVRRGVEIVQTARVNSASNEVRVDIPAWGSTLVLATIIFFSLVICSISYTYGEVITTLAAVEAPQSTVITCTPPEYSDDTKEPLLSGDNKPADIEQEQILIKQRPLTSRFCAIRRHLRARGGRLARYRGLHVYLISELSQNMLVTALAAFLGSSIAYFVLDIAVFVLFTRWQLLWTHMVISEPSQKPFLQRMGSKSDVKKALMPTFVYAIIVRLAALSTIYFATVFQGENLNLFFVQIPLHGDGSSTTRLLLSIGVLMICIFNVVAIQIPALVSITRVRASLLSLEEEPIISFDRTFNSQIVPGVGVLGFWQAWAGCDLATRFRVLRVVFKTMVMQVVVVALAALVLVGEMRLILGPEWLSSLISISTGTMMRGLAF